MDRHHVGIPMFVSHCPQRSGSSSPAAERVSPTCREAGHPHLQREAGMPTPRWGTDCGTRRRHARRRHSHLMKPGVPTGKVSNQLKQSAAERCHRRPSTMQKRCSGSSRTDEAGFEPKENRYEHDAERPMAALRRIRGEPRRAGTPRRELQPAERAHHPGPVSRVRAAAKPQSGAPKHHPGELGDQPVRRRAQHRERPPPVLQRPALAQRNPKRAPAGTRRLQHSARRPARAHAASQGGGTGIHETETDGSRPHDRGTGR